MKRIIIFSLLLLLLAVAPLNGAITNTVTGKKATAYWWTGDALKDTAYLNMCETETLLSATAGTSTASKALILGATTNVDTLLFSGGYIKLTPVASIPLNEEGVIYMDTDHILYYRNASTVVALTSGTGDNTLDNAYDQGGDGSGKTITASDGAVTITSTDADTAYLLSITPTPGSAAALGGISIVSGSHSTQDSLNIANSGSGYSISSDSDSFTVDSSGNIVGASITATTATVTTQYIQNLTSAAAGNVNIAIDAAGSGTITLGGTSTGKIVTDNTLDLDGDVDTTGATFIAGVTLDDGTTNSPALTLQDATNETCAIVKLDDGDTTVTIPADTDFEIVAGNLAVGNGTPGTAAMDGEDLYVNDQLEVDGAAQFDGAVTCASTLTIAGTATFSGGQTRKVMFQPKEVELDGANPPALSDHGTDAQCNISALQFDADGGVTGDDIAYISWLVPDGYVVDSARLNVCYTFSTAEDAADEAQFDFAVNAVAAGETLDAAGTALADQTTVITDASTGNGKLYITQYTIETEAIAVDDLVTIKIAVDESASALAASGTLDVLYFEIEYESTE